MNYFSDAVEHPDKSKIKENYIIKLNITLKLNRFLNRNLCNNNFLYYGIKSQYFSQLMNH